MSACAYGGIHALLCLSGKQPLPCTALSAQPVHGLAVATLQLAICLTFSQHYCGCACMHLRVSRRQCCVVVLPFQCSTVYVPHAVPLYVVILSAVSAFDICEAGSLGGGATGKSTEGYMHAYIVLGWWFCRL